jgi:hypothetical protein
MASNWSTAHNKILCFIGQHNSHNKTPLHPGRINMHSWSSRKFKTAPTAARTHLQLWQHLAILEWPLIGLPLPMKSCVSSVQQNSHNKTPLLPGHLELNLSVLRKFYTAPTAARDPSAAVVALCDFTRAFCSAPAAAKTNVLLRCSRTHNEPPLHPAGFSAF